MIYQQIKDDLIESIRERSTDRDYIRVVISEFDRIGKNLTDAQCLKELTRLKKTAVTMNSGKEIIYLDKYLPELMSKSEIETQISYYLDSGMNNMGQIMGAFNTQFKGKADNKLVSQVVIKLLKT